jgi:hypothetical protein
MRTFGSRNPAATVVADVMSNASSSGRLLSAA